MIFFLNESGQDVFQWLTFYPESKKTGHCPSPAPQGPDEPTSGETPADLGISQLRPAGAQFNHVSLRLGEGSQGTLKALSGLQAPGTPAAPPGSPSPRAWPAARGRTCLCHFYPKSSNLLPSVIFSGPKERRKTSSNARFSGPQPVSSKLPLARRRADSAIAPSLWVRGSLPLGS